MNIWKPIILLLMRLKQLRFLIQSMSIHLLSLFRGCPNLYCTNINCKRPEVN